MLLFGSGAFLFSCGHVAKTPDGRTVIMAKVLGNSGRFVSDDATRKRNAIWTRIAVAISVISATWGLMAGSTLRVMTVPLWGSGLLSVVFMLVICLIWKWSSRRLDELGRRRENLLRGAAGEMKVGLILEALPDEFHVINDLPTPSGNLDHVVVGPTGVFVVETKDWRGVVSEDGNGDLKWSGGTVKTPVKVLVARTMETRERVLALAPEVNVFFKAVFVFTSAWVDARFGKTGYADCVRDDRLREYLLDEKGRKKLAGAQVRLLARAFAGLAQMHPEFTAAVEERTKTQEEVVALPKAAAA